MTRRQHKKIVDLYKDNVVYHTEVWLDHPRINGILAYRNLDLSLLFDIVIYDRLMLHYNDDSFMQEEGEQIEYYDLQEKLATKERMDFYELKAMIKK